MFEVEWVTDVPVNECGDCEPDLGQFHVRYFKNREAAIRFAKKVLPLDYWGSVSVTECYEEYYEPGRPGKYIEYIGEAEYVSEV